MVKLSGAPGQTFNNTYSYDAASNRLSLQSPEGSTSYAYDQVNRLTDITSSWAGHFGFGYDDLSRRTSLTRPNGQGTSYSYDSVSHLLSVLHGPTSAPTDGASYTYDNAGNRTSKQNARTGVQDGYTYDDIYELTKVVQAANTTEQYSYDQVGNRLSDLTSSGWTYNLSNQLGATPSTTFSYDNNGNTISKVDANGTTGFTWDFENRLTQVTLPVDTQGNGGGVVSFKYDSFGRRIQKSAPSATTNFVYDGANIVAEYDGSGAMQAKYAQGAGIDEPLAMNRQGSTVFYNADGLGSIVSLVDGSGAQTNTYTYDAFGKRTNTTGTLFNPFQYTGREWDSETGLYYYRARYYDEGLGRFASEDQLRHKAGPNFYQYVRNQPTVLIDPLGNDPTDFLACGYYYYRCVRQVTSCSKAMTEAINNGTVDITNLCLQTNSLNQDEAQVKVCASNRENCSKAAQKCRGILNVPWDKAYSTPESSTPTTPGKQKFPPNYPGRPPTDY